MGTAILMASGMLHNIRAIAKFPNAGNATRNVVKAGLRARQGFDYRPGMIEITSGL